MDKFSNKLSRYATRLAALGTALLLSSVSVATNRLFVNDATYGVGATGIHIPVECENDQDVLGVSIAVDFDPAVLDVTEIVLGGPVSDAEWSDGEISSGRVKYGVVFDLQIVEILPPAPDTTVLELVANVVAASATTTSIDFRDADAEGDSGGEFNVMVSSEGAPIGNASFESGTITIDDAPPEVVFVRGDSNSSGGVDLSDAVNTLNWLFLGFADPLCLDAVDTNDDGKTDLTDAVSILNFLFLGLASPPPPGHLQCGVDPSDDALGDCDYPSDKCP